MGDVRFAEHNIVSRSFATVLLLAGLSVTVIVPGVARAQDGGLSSGASGRLRINLVIPPSIQVSGFAPLLSVASAGPNAIQGDSDITVTVLDRFEGVVSDTPPGISRGDAEIADAGVVIRETLCIRGETNAGYALRATTDPGTVTSFELRNELNESLPFAVYYKSQDQGPGEQLKPERRSAIHYANRNNPQCAEGDNAMFEFHFPPDVLVNTRSGAYAGIVRFTVIGQ